MNGTFLIPFSRTLLQAVCEAGVCAKASEGSAEEAGAIAVSIGGTIGGLLAVAVIVAATLAVVIHRNGRHSKTASEAEFGAGADITSIIETIFETMSDHYVSQENTDQIGTAASSRLSIVIE
jgi:hypothetical protein